MSSAHEIVTAYWAAANDRDWRGFGALLADDVVYQLPQTRERVRGRAAYVRFNAEYPGEWHATVERIIGQGRHATSWTTFRTGDTDQTGLCYFVLNDTGRICEITDFWPEPYNPPPGREHLVERY